MFILTTNIQQHTPRTDNFVQLLRCSYCTKPHVALKFKTPKQGTKEGSSLLAHSLSVRWQLLLLKALPEQTRGFPWSWIRAAAFIFAAQRGLLMCNYWLNEWCLHGECHLLVALHVCLDPLERQEFGTHLLTTIWQQNVLTCSTMQDEEVSYSPHSVMTEKRFVLTRFKPKKIFCCKIRLQNGFERGRVRTCLWEELQVFGRALINTTPPVVQHICFNQITVCLRWSCAEA